jgi:hypothetical protein
MSFRVVHKIKCELPQVLNVSEMSILPANGIKKVSGEVDKLLHRKTYVQAEVLGAMAEKEARATATSI